MTKGIYGYFDKQMNKIVYVGKDSNIDKDIRHKTHTAPSHYNQQQINRVLQNNLDRFEYRKLIELSDDFTNDDLNDLEIHYIKVFNPRFNFTDGGEGLSGFKHSKETKQKMSDAKKGEKNSMYGVRLTGEKNHNYGKLIPEETCVKMSKAQNTSGYFRVSKFNKPDCKQGFIFGYRYWEKGKHKTIVSVDINKLEEKVKSCGLPWIKFEKYREE